MCVCVYVNTKTSQKRREKKEVNNNTKKKKKKGGGGGGLIPYPAVLDEGRQVSEDTMCGLPMFPHLWFQWWLQVRQTIARSHTHTHTHTEKPSNQYGGAGMAQSLMIEWRTCDQKVNCGFEFRQGWWEKLSFPGSTVLRWPCYCTSM